MSDSGIFILGCVVYAFVIAATLITMIGTSDDDAETTDAARRENE